MVQDLFDEKITKALKNGTKQSSEAVHEENLQSILHKIHEIDKGERKMPKRKSAWGKVVSIATAAAVMLIVLGTYTQPGQAAWEKIREYFEPEKKVETEIEGSKETVDTRLQQSDMGYVIYYDQDRYKIEEDGEIDRIVTKETYEGYPEVYMEISQDGDSTPEELAARFEEELKADFSKVDAAREVTEPVEGIYIHAIDGGTQWDDEVVNYYLVDNTQGGTFIIKQKYFLEAAEGHGARFYHMLEEFVIVPEESQE